MVIIVSSVQGHVVPNEFVNFIEITFYVYAIMLLIKLSIIKIAIADNYSDNKYSNTKFEFDVLVNK